MKFPPLARLGLGLASAAILLTAAAASGTHTATDHVLLLSWDGVRRDALHSLLEYQPIDAVPVNCPSARREPTIPVPCGDYLTCLPNLCQLTLINSRAIEGKPLTRPQHAQMLTGYGPLETGTIANSGRKGLEPGMTVYERLTVARPEVKTVHIAGRKFVGRGIVTNAMRSGALQLSLRRGGRDGFTGASTTDQAIAGFDFIDGSPFFMFVHYKTADVIAHRAHDTSDAYREAIIANDLELGNIIFLLGERGFGDTAKLFVTTDHGFDGKFHVNPAIASITETWLASYPAGTVTGPATVLDVTPTILDAFGIDIAAIEPPYRGKSLLAH